MLLPFLIISSKSGAYYYSIYFLPNIYYILPLYLFDWITFFFCLFACLLFLIHIPLKCKFHKGRDLIVFIHNCIPNAQEIIFWMNEWMNGLFSIDSWTISVGGLKKRWCPSRKQRSLASAGKQLRLPIWEVRYEWWHSKDFLSCGRINTLKRDDLTKVSWDSFSLRHRLGFSMNCKQENPGGY